MKNIAKKIFPYLPVSFRRFFYGLYEDFYALLSKIKDGKLFQKDPKRPFQNKDKAKKRLLFYHISGLSFGGTEKFLQIIAKHINKDRYEVAFMYSPDMDSGRKNYLGEEIKLIPFSFSKRENKYPFYVKGMNPSLSEVISKYEIDLLITAGSGYSEHPINTIQNTPIVMINIFGSPSTQKNIVKQVSISHEVERKIRLIVPDSKCEVMYIPSEEPPANSIFHGEKLRKELGIPESAMVFGRIGRGSDDIHDPIGIEAFKKVVSQFPETHYIIQAPPPKLVKKVGSESIPNVHFLDPTADEEKIWAFHHAIDALAHFRFDGESCGLNIIESMIAGKPIITHRSGIWNAHLEYLEPLFSRIAPKDDIDAYADFMKEFIELKINGKLGEMGIHAREKSRVFLIENNIEKFEGWIDQSIVEYRDGRLL